MREAARLNALWERQVGSVAGDSTGLGTQAEQGQVLVLPSSLGLVSEPQLGEDWNLPRVWAGLLSEVCLA